MSEFKTFIKVVITLFSPFIALHFFSNEEYFLGALCSMSFGIMVYVVKNSFDDLFSVDYEYAQTSYQNTKWVSDINWWKKDEEKNIEKVSEKCVINKNIINMEQVNTTSTIQLPPIKEIIALELEKKEKVIDITKDDKPSFSMADVLTKPIVNTTPIQQTQDSTAILIKNKSTLSLEEIGTYKTIIEVLNKYNLMADKKYALLQSFTFIDVCPRGIVIYIDYDILQKAQLDESCLHKEEIISELRKAMHCDQLAVHFEKYRVKNLLNYFLEKK